MQVNLTTLSGQSYRFDAEPSDLVETLKSKIFHELSVNPKQQRLVFNGKKLEDCYTLKDYNIQDGGKIYLVLRLRGGM
ncbi:hypothetical protein QYM36_004472 [Artemia franciscana]|uniref:Ubiquitin-like domain-containing protein n=1 Tax=Artemia franciscana TaxID=6661 RepID=A0AA88L869_ARTSF|nr:hypothetical protein QYM36_004472 [Artemia franciscana]